MLVACRLAGLSALEGHYVGVSVRAQFGGALRLRGTSDDFSSEPGNGAEYRTFSRLCASRCAAVRSSGGMNEPRKQNP